MSQKKSKINETNQMFHTEKIIHVVSVCNVLDGDILLHRRRRGGRGRFPIQPRIDMEPKAESLIPNPSVNEPAIYLDLAEAEVLRLVDIEGLYQEDAGSRMGVSRGTIWRLLSSARSKMARALFEGRKLIVGIAEETSE